MAVRCLLIDDEPPALDVLESYIQLVDGLEVVGKCHNAIQAFGVLQEKAVDLLFLDISMPKLLGTDFLRSLRQPPKVIFTTAYPNYALESYELDAVDYLLKPIPFERFMRSVAKVMRAETAVIEPTEADRNSPATATRPFLYFRVDRKMVKVFLDDILYVESLKDYIKIITITAKPLVVKQSISSLEAMLPDTAFVRIHRSFIVSLSKITAYTANQVDVRDQPLPIGRLYQRDVSRLLS